MMGKRKLIVLMYHGVISDASQMPPDREAGAELYDLPVTAFRGQMDYLKKNSYEVVRLEKALAQAAGREVVLTFDDGEMNNFTQAYPILKRHQFPAFFFVTINRVGQKGYMDWAQIKELVKGGMIIGSHGLNHEILLNLTEEEIEKELMESKEILEDSLGKKVEDFSVPRGFFNDQIVDMAREIGYSHIFVSQNGFLPYKNCIGRIAVKGSWSFRRFEKALLGHQPLGEMWGKTLKSIAKKILGPGAYDRVRERLLGK